MSVVNSLQSLGTIAHSAVTVVRDEMNDIAPFTEKSWHWRTIIVIVGAGCSLGALAAFILNLTTLAVLCSLIATAALCFAVYYVSLYTQQKTLNTLITTLNQEVTDLTSHNQTLAEHNQTLAEHNQTLGNTAQTLKEQAFIFKYENEELQKNLETTSQNLSELQSLQADTSANLESLQQIHNDYMVAHQDFATQIELHLALMKTMRIQSDELGSHIQAQSAEQARLTENIAKLEEIRALIANDLTAVTSGLKDVFSKGESHATTLSLMIYKLTESFAGLRELVAGK